MKHNWVQAYNKQGKEFTFCKDCKKVKMNIFVRLYNWITGKEQQELFIDLFNNKGDK